jgi:hypothetical protein
MSRESGSRHASPSRPVPHRLSAAVLASRWHIDYEHYARVLRARAERCPAEFACGPAVSRTPAPPVEDPSTLELWWSRAVESLRLGRGAVRRPAAAFRRAS